MPFEASVQSSICLQMNECTDMDELEAFDEYGIEKILLEDGRSHAFDYHKRKGPEDSSIVNNHVWCDEILYGDKDGLLKEFGVMTNEDKEMVNWTSERSTQLGLSITMPGMKEVDVPLCTDLPVSSFVPMPIQAMESESINQTNCIYIHFCIHKHGLYSDRTSSCLLEYEKGSFLLNECRAITTRLLLSVIPHGDPACVDRSPV